MAQLPCIGLSWPLTKPPFGSCAIYFHHGVTFRLPNTKPVWRYRIWTPPKKISAQFGPNRSGNSQVEICLATKMITLTCGLVGNGFWTRIARRHFTEKTIPRHSMYGVFYIFYLHLLPKSSWIYHMGVSKNKGIPKWMVYIGKPY